MEQKYYFNYSFCLMNIREIMPDDTVQMAAIIRQVILEMEAPTTGTAFEDKALEDLYAAYQGERAVYYILEDNGDVVGGAGIAPLQNADNEICELQKMYFLPQARGKGFGLKLIQECLREAVTMGFSYCYIETMPTMTAAQNLYRQIGFQYLDSAMGDTGHCSCEVWMLKKLN